MATTLRLASRASALALAQTRWVQARLEAWHPGLTTEIVTASTVGDRDKASPLTSLGQGIFVKGVEEMLLSGRADLAVHSLKDVPTAPTPGLVMAAIPTREDPRDGLVVAEHFSAAVREGGVRALPHGARVGTGSPRRAAQLWALRPDLEICPLRGNLDSRVSKLRAGKFDAIVVALAGLARLGRLDEVDWAFDPDECTPAVGQGALAVQCRADDERALGLAQRIDDPLTRIETEAERAFLAALGGGCQLPAGALARADDLTISVLAVVASADGRRLAREYARGPAALHGEVGRELARRLASRAERFSSAPRHG